MTIHKINSYLAQAPQKVSGSNQASNGNVKASSSKQIPAATDSVQLSKKSQEMDQLQRSVTEREQLRSQHLAQLQNQVQNNTYPIQPHKIADKMLQEML